MKFDLSDRDNQTFVLSLFVLAVGFILIGLGWDGEIKALLGAVLGYFFGKKRG